MGNRISTPIARQGNNSRRLCRSVSVESVMHSKYLSRGGPLRTGLQTAVIDDPAFWELARVESQAAIREQRGDAVEHWPKTRMLALLMIHRSDNALAVIARLSGTDVRPRQHDFAALRNHGYAKKELAERYHQLTPQGRRAAERCADVLGNELGMHLPTYIFDSWSEHRARCCCGWSASVNRRANSNAADRLATEFGKHLADPQDWKRRRLKVQEIIDKVGTGTLGLFRKTGDAS